MSSANSHKNHKTNDCNWDHVTEVYELVRGTQTPHSSRGKLISGAAALEECLGTMRSSDARSGRLP